MTILICGDYLWNDAAGTPTVTWFRENFPGATVTPGNYADTTNAAVRAAIEAADILVINRRTYSGGYDAADAAYYATLSKPVIYLTSYVTRSSRMAIEGGLNAGVAVGGAETTVTAAGAAILGVAAGTYDFYTVGFDTLGTGSVGTGKRLATIGGNNLAVLWEVGDTDASGRTQAGKRLLYNVDAIGGGDPTYPNYVRFSDTAAGMAAFTHAVKSLISRTDAAHDPVVLPENEDGSSGTLQANNADVQVTFSFKAGLNSERTAVNPGIVGHYIYLTNGTSDPNLYLLDYVEHGDVTNPDVLHGPFTLVNAQGKTFKWKAEEALDDGAGNPFPSGDPNNIMGDVWTFKAVGASPHILSGPVHTLTDASGNAILAITTSSVANNYQWFKVVGVKDTPGGETDDIKLADSGIYSRTTTKTLTITGAASNGSDDTQVYAIAYNGDPAVPGVPSATSPAAWFWYPRLVNHYTFETLTDGVTPDVASGYNMTVLSNDVGTDVPVLDTNVVSGITGTKSLKFNNPRGTDPNSADAQYAQISEGWAGGYKDLTISMWVYSSGGSNWNRILDFGNDTNNYTFICINPGSVNRQVRFAVKVAGTEQTVSSAAGALPDNTWTYVTATLKDNTARIYINGELVGTNASFTNDPISYGPTVNNWIARSQWGSNDGYFNGMLDELNIYNYARTTEQVAQDYLATQGDWICNRELYNLPYDYDGNCRVDIGDFAIFAAQWMESYRIYPD
jgi:hypothetical protein